jgi:vacuolar protein sorting-associated protein VTA1
LKSEIGQHDVIANDVASAAYVENFALKIFAIADNEDRSGRTTKGTAKKFLAAVTFLELLKDFDDAQLSESVSDCTHFIAWGSTE